MKKSPALWIVVAASFSLTPSALAMSPYVPPASPVQQDDGYVDQQDQYVDQQDIYVDQEDDQYQEIQYPGSMSELRGELRESNRQRRQRHRAEAQAIRRAKRDARRDRRRENQNAREDNRLARRERRHAIADYKAAQRGEAARLRLEAWRRSHDRYGNVIHGGGYKPGQGGVVQQDDDQYQNQVVQEQQIIRNPVGGTIIGGGRPSWGTRAGPDQVIEEQQIYVDNNNGPRNDKPGQGGSGSVNDPIDGGNGTDSNNGPKPGQNQNQQTDNQQVVDPIDGGNSGPVVKTDPKPGNQDQQEICDPVQPEQPGCIMQPPHGDKKVVKGEIPVQEDQQQIVTCLPDQCDEPAKPGKKIVKGVVPVQQDDMQELEDQALQEINGGYTGKTRLNRLDRKIARKLAKREKIQAACEANPTSARCIGIWRKAGLRIGNFKRGAKDHLTAGWKGLIHGSRYGQQKGGGSKVYDGKPGSNKPGTQVAQYDDQQVGQQDQISDPMANNVGSAQ